MTTLRLEQREGAAIVTIDRADRSNALSRDTLRAFAELESPLTAAPDVRAIVITGAGTRAFCAGADLKERRHMSLPEIRDQLRAYRGELGWLERTNKPVVAAINGAALGGGLELALLCDLRIASRNATFALPETRLGIIPGAGGTQRLPRLIGEARAKELILLGRTLNADEAHGWGLLNQVIETPEDLINETLRWLNPILHGAPLAQRAALTAIRASSGPLEAGLDTELAAYEECLESEDRIEALTAFAEKRPPEFKGR